MYQKVVLNTLQKSVLLVPCCVVVPIDVGMVTVPCAC